MEARLAKVRKRKKLAQPTQAEERERGGEEEREEEPREEVSYEGKSQGGCGGTVT